MWHTEKGGIFKTEEEAREACLEDMEFEEFEEFFSQYISYNQLLQWALKQNQFFEDFADFIDEAEEDFLTNSYYYIEEKEQEKKMEITDCPDGFVAEIKSEEDFIMMMELLFGEGSKNEG